MRTQLYIVLLGLMLLAPVKRLDVSKLEPVEAVAVTLENGMVCLTTDTEAEGKGITAEEALLSMKENTSGIIYLDTARFLLIGENAEDAAQDLKSWLRKNVRICKYSGSDVKEETKRLDAHDLSTKPWG